MAITSNINQANLQAQTRALNEQQAFETQRRSQVFQAQESEKTRKHQTSMYNLKAGDKFMEDNPIMEYTAEQQSTLGDALAIEYSTAQEEILKAKDMITSGDTKSRIEGQTMLTKANNRLKAMAQDLQIVEADTEEMANGDLVGGPNADLIKTMYRNNVEGTTKILSNENGRKDNPDDQNAGRFIQYVDEDGSQKVISMDAYKKILKGAVGRVDVNNWVEETAKNLASDQFLQGGKTVQKLRSPEALDTHVNNWTSDPDVMHALKKQIGTEDAGRRQQRAVAGTHNCSQQCAYEQCDGHRV